MPLLGVKRIVRKGNDIVFTENGGYIQHRTYGRCIDFIGREGVYFVRMKITGPDSRDPDPAGVARQGSYMNVTDSSVTLPYKARCFS